MRLGGRAFALAELKKKKKPSEGRREGREAKGSEGKRSEAKEREGREEGERERESDV